MVFTAAQTTNFFTDLDQMALDAATRGELIIEGIATVADLAEYEEEEFKQVVKNLRNPPDIADQANPGHLVRVPAFVLNAKSLKRLKVAADAARYYEAIGRDLTPANMHYTNVLSKFELQWRSILEKKKATPPTVPKISRTLRVTKWSESFINFLNRVIGARYAPLSYVIRKVMERVDPPPALARQQPYSEVYGSVEGELIARLSHTSPIYRDDNAKVFDYLEEATRGTIVAASLMPFRTRKDGRGAFMAVMLQHAGPDKWESELKQQETFLKKRYWKGNTSLTSIDSPSSTAMHTFQCNNVLNISPISSRTKGQELDISWMQSSVLTPNYRLHWLECAKMMTR